MTRLWELAGFVTIAAALHVSAAAMFRPGGAQPGEGASPAQASLSAGSGALADLVAAWEAPPVTDTAPGSMRQPDAPEQATETPLPEVSPMTNAPPTLPASALELDSFTAPEPPANPAATLTASARPSPRPAPQKAAPTEAPRTSPPKVQASKPAPGGGSAGASVARSPGGGGISAGQKAELMGQWGARIRACISRRATAPRGLRQGGRVVLSLRIARNGAVQSVGLAGSSGQPALDQAAISAARRAGGCPAAPPALTDASYNFQLPINLQLR